MSKSITITPHHLPRGTVIETGLYRQPHEGEVGPQWHPGETPNPAQLTVDHILIVDGWAGRNYMVVTTTPRPDDSHGVGKTLSFNIDYVDRVVKRGHKTVFKSYKDADAPRKDSWINKREYSSNYVYSLIDFKLNQEHPLIQFDIESMFSAAVRCGVIRHNASDPSQSKYLWYWSMNRRKFNTWIMRNKNRFIFSAKTLASIKKSALDEENRYLENEWDREYLQNTDEVAESSDTDHTTVDKGTRY